MYVERQILRDNRKIKHGFSTVWGVAAAAKSLQSCPTLCDPIDGSTPGPPIPRIFQARTLEWVAISFSNAGKWKVKVKLLSPVWLFETPWTAVYQDPLSMGFSRQEYWSGVPLPSPCEGLASLNLALFKDQRHFSSFVRNLMTLIYKMKQLLIPSDFHSFLKICHCPGELNSLHWGSRIHLQRTLYKNV